MGEVVCTSGSKTTSVIQSQNVTFVSLSGHVSGVKIIMYAFKHKKSNDPVELFIPINNTYDYCPVKSLLRYEYDKIKSLLTQENAQGQNREKEKHFSLHHQGKKRIKYYKYLVSANSKPPDCMWLNAKYQSFIRAASRRERGPCKHVSNEVTLRCMLCSYCDLRLSSYTL